MSKRVVLQRTLTLVLGCTMMGGAGVSVAFDMGNMMNPSKWMGGGNDRDDYYDRGYGYGRGYGPGYGYGGPGYGYGGPGYGYGAPGYGYGGPGYGYGAPAYGYGAPGYGYGAPAGQAAQAPRRPE